MEAFYIAPDKKGYQVNIFFLFFHKNVCCVYSLEIWKNIIFFFLFGWKKSKDHDQNAWMCHWFGILLFANEKNAGSPTYLLIHCIYSCICQPWSCWTHICQVFANSVDPDKLASKEVNWSGSALFVIKYVNLYQQLSNLIGWNLEMGMAS